MAIEQTKKTHASINFHMKPRLNSGLKHIEVLKNFIDWNNIPKFKTIQLGTIIDPEPIKEKLISRNMLYLGQAQGTLLSTPEVIQLNDTDYVSNVLNPYCSVTLIPLICN